MRIKNFGMHFCNRLKSGWALDWWSMIAIILCSNSLRYTKTVVAATVNAQKYNPELPWTQRNPDPRIAQLSDKLRHIRQVAMSQLTLAPESDSYLRDEEGSGSGHPPVTQWIDDDEADPNWPDEGSASGDNPIDPGIRDHGESINRKPPSSGGRDIVEPPTVIGPGGDATKPVAHSCALLVLAVLLSRISLVLLNG